MVYAYKLGICLCLGYVRNVKRSEQVGNRLEFFRGRRISCRRSRGCRGRRWCWNRRRGCRYGGVEGLLCRRRSLLEVEMGSVD